MVVRAATMFDPDCCSQVVYINGWPVIWGVSLIDFDPKEGVSLAARTELGALMTFEYCQAHGINVNNADTAPWFGGQHVIVNKLSAPITQVIAYAFDVCSPYVQELLATARGNCDRQCGRTSWCRAAYPYAYNLQRAYDRGYRK